MYHLASGRRRRINALVGTGKKKRTGAHAERNDENTFRGSSATTRRKFWSRLRELLPRMLLGNQGKRALVNFRVCNAELDVVASLPPPLLAPSLSFFLPVHASPGFYYQLVSNEASTITLPAIVVFRGFRRDPC